jgi:hypothetical protein
LYSAWPLYPNPLQMDLDWTIAMKGLKPQLSRQALVPGGNVEISHENLFGDSQSLSLSLSASDWRNPGADLGFQLSYTEPFFAPNTTRNVQLFNTRKMSPIFTSPVENEVHEGMVAPGRGLGRWLALM